MDRGFAKIPTSKLDNSRHIGLGSVGSREASLEGTTAGDYSTLHLFNPIQPLNRSHLLERCKYLKNPRSTRHLVLSVGDPGGVAALGERVSTYLPQNARVGRRSVAQNLEIAEHTAIFHVGDYGVDGIYEIFLRLGLCGFGGLFGVFSPVVSSCNALRVCHE